MSPESQTTIRRLSELADKYTRSSFRDRERREFSLAAACEIRASKISDAIGEIERMEFVTNPSPHPSGT